MFGLPTDNPNNLRVVGTARTEDAINRAAKEGLRPLLKKVEPSDQIHDMVAVYQNQATGEIVLSGDCRMRPSEGFVEVLPRRTFYPYSFPAPFAAYLVPSDLSEGDRVWLEDIIEDIIAVFGSQGWHPRLECAEAIWTGKDFEIQFDPEKDAEILIG